MKVNALFTSSVAAAAAASVTDAVDDSVLTVDAAVASVFAALDDVEADPPLLPQPASADTAIIAPRDALAIFLSLAFCIM